MTTYESIPRALAQAANWLCYRLTDTGKGRLSKPPVSPKTGIVCAKNDETQFTTLEEALVGMERYDLDGVGFVFTTGFVAIDLDDCFGEDGALKPVAQDIFDHFPTYWEYSPSGNGLHGFMYGTKPNDRTKDTALGIEVYSGFNFVTVTGDRVDGTATDAMPMQDALDWLYETYLPPLTSPTTVAPVNHGAKTSDEWLALGLAKDSKLQRLYNLTDHEGTDESSADFALLSKLAYWLNRDTDAMSAAFLTSPWTRTKDAEHTKKLKRDDYLPDSMGKAAALCSATAQENSKSFETKAVRFFTLGASEDGVPPNISVENHTDLGNAEAMAEVYGDILCYTPEWGWCFYDGTRWQTDVHYRAMEAARDIALGIMASALSWLERVRAECDDEGIPHESESGKERLRGAMALYTHALKSQSEHGITAMVNLNKAFMQTSADTFDTDPWLLNTPTGVVDLKSGETMPHDAKYRLTTMTAVSPERKPTPMFDAFLSKVFCADVELIAFTQRVLGSALVGKVYNENLIIANGTGANGKSTLFNTVQHLLGDYATSIDPDLLMSSKASDQQVGMAMLQGKRFAVAQETEEGQRFSSSRLKRLVSTDTMVVKKLYHNPHEVVPQHMLVLSTNHLPKVSSTDLGTWRRIVVLPFEAVISPEEMITDFHSLLMEREGAGILAWAIEGTVAFCAEGCDIATKPEAVMRASSEYRVGEDWIAGFMGECCTSGDPNDESVFVRHTDLYRVYNRWAKDGGEYVRSSNAFGKALQSAGWHGKQKWYDPERKSTTKIWFGFELLDGGRPFNLVQTGKAEQ